MEKENANSRAKGSNQFSIEMEREVGEKKANGTEK
jgi:hypothetical protein